MTTTQLTASTISAKGFALFEGLRSSRTVKTASFAPLRQNISRSFPALVVKAATTITPKYTSLNPLGDRVLVKLRPAEEKSVGGILLPTTAQSKPQGGEVVAVGEGREIGKNKVEISVKVGTQIVYSKYAGTELEFNGAKHLIVKEDDIVGILDTDDVKDLKPLNDRVLIKAAPKEALENFLGSFKKEQSIEDLLRQQIKKQEFFDDGGTGGGGLGGGGGGSGGGSGGSEDENTSDELDEIFQVTMATLGFIYTYIYILRGEEIGRYIRDIIRYYIFRGRKSIRLTKLLARLNKHWTIIKGKYGNRLTDDEMDEVEGHLLTHLVKKTGTWYYRPKQAQKKVEKRAIVDPVYGEEYYEDDDEYYY